MRLWRRVCGVCTSPSVGYAVERAYAHSDVFEKRRKMMDAWLNTRVGGGRGGRSRYSSWAETRKGQPGMMFWLMRMNPGTWRHQTRNPEYAEPSGSHQGNLNDPARGSQCGRRR